MQRKVVIAAVVTALVIILIFTLRKDKFSPQFCALNRDSPMCVQYWNDDDEAITPEYTRRP